MTGEDDRILLLRNRDDSFDKVSQDSNDYGSGDFYELQPQGNDSRDKESCPLPVANDSVQPNSIVYIASCVAAVGGVLFGYDMGIISGAKAQLQADFRLTCTQLEGLVTTLPVGALVASLMGGFFIDTYGRKWSIIMNAMLFTLGALLMATTSNFLVLVLGRFILGFAVSLSAIAECIYIAEIATSGKRGMLVSLNELGITVGILIAFLVNYIFTDVSEGWRYMFGLSAFIAVVQGIAMLVLPQTPQFLMLKGKEAKAEEVVRKLQLTNNARQYLTNIRLTIAEEQNQGSKRFCSFICSEESRASNMGSRLLIGIGLVFFQQFTGQPNIIYYAADIFRQVGFCDEFSSTLASVGLGLMKVFSTGVSLVIVDGIGRRKALMFGIVLMAFSILSLSVFAFYQEAYDLSSTSVSRETCVEINENLFGMNATSHNSTNTDCPVSNLSNGARYFAFASLVLFVCSFSFSFGPVVWILLSEIFPASTKGRAMALATSVNWLANVFVSGTFLQATSTFSIGGVFLFYFLMCCSALTFVGLVVPETKNRSLEEISKDLRSKRGTSLIKDNLFWRKSHRPTNRNVYSHIALSADINC